MSVLTHPLVPPSKAKSDAIRCVVRGLVPFIQSSPGLGKSSLVREIAQEGNLKVIDVRLSQSAPEDLQGLPMRSVVNGVEKAHFVPFNTFPLASDPIPDGFKGWLLFLDEFNSASRSVQAAAYKLTLDRLVGLHPLHPQVAIICAGNLSTDKAIVNNLGTAMQSRVSHILMESSKPEWIEWATKAGIDYRVIGFIEFQPSKLHLFNPDHSEMTFPCPRTWEFVSKLILDTPDVSDMMSLIAGTIGMGVGFEFVKFCEEYTRIPKLSSIVNDPKNIMIPMEISTRFAVLTMLMAHVDLQNVKKVIQYVGRFEPDEQIIFYRGCLNRDPKLREVDEVAAELVKVMRFVNSN
jgi:hypothetical protein